MSNNIYITATDRRAGKTAVVLGIMELLSRHSQRVGFFRPLVANTGRDNAIDLIIHRYHPDLPYEAMVGCDLDTARTLLARDRYDELLKTILDRYKALEERCDHVLCMGAQLSDATPLEFDFNADVANNLGCPVLPVVNGLGRTAQQVVDAAGTLIHSLQHRGCEVLAGVVNRVPPATLKDTAGRLEQALSIPVYVLPEEPVLSKPTVDDIARELHAEQVFGQPRDLYREISDYKVAAMGVSHFLDYIDAGTFVITPGDRDDIVLGSLLSYLSSRYPQIAGILLTGGQTPSPQVQRLVEGLDQLPVAVLGVPSDTFTTAMDVNAVEARIRPENERKIAAALGLVEAHMDLESLQRRMQVTRAKRTTPLMFEYQLMRRAKADRRHIVLPEAEDERILRAAEILLLRGVVDITLLGDPEQVHARATRLGLRLQQARVVDPLHSPWRDEFAHTYFQLRKHKGISAQIARDTVTDLSYFGTMMVYHGYADGMVSGAAHTTQHTIRPAFEVIKTAPGRRIVSSVFFMCLADRVLVYGDCAVNPDPNAEQLADIAIGSAETARMFGVEPRVAMLSYSTGDSGKGSEVDKVRQATRIARERRPDLKLEGPMQYDAAIEPSVARSKLPGSEVAGCATVFVFPDLNTGNNTYKAVQRSAHAVAIGPVLQGLNKPVNDLSRGCEVPDIVNTVAITAIQAQAQGNDAKGDTP